MNTKDLVEITIWRRLRDIGVEPSSVNGADPLVVLVADLLARVREIEKELTDQGYKK